MFRLSGCLWVGVFRVPGPRPSTPEGPATKQSADGGDAVMSDMELLRQLTLFASGDEEGDAQPRGTVEEELPAFEEVVFPEATSDP